MKSKKSDIAEQLPPSEFLARLDELLRRAPSEELIASWQRYPHLGRPKREPKPGERVPLSLRVTPEIKSRLDDAAQKNGRSQSQEAEMRIERSFDREDLLSEVLTLAYGKTAARFLMRLGPLIAESRDQKP